MQSPLKVAVLFFLLTVGFSSDIASQQPLPPSVTVRWNQLVDLAPSIFSTAKESCENWALAAGLETMLQRQDVALDQKFWVRRLSGGDLCVRGLPSIDELSRVVNQEFALADGRRVRLELHFVPGAPVDTSALIAGLRRQELSLFLWHGHPYYMSGATYDEYISGEGARMFVVKELRLANTFSKQPAVTFQRGRDNNSEVAGILSISVSSP